MLKALIYLFLAGLLTVVQAPVANCQPKVEVEVETGPEFSGDDGYTVWQCITNHYHERFPFDFYAAPSLEDTQCPNATFWGKNFEFCWLIDIFHTIEPAILIGMLVFAIMVL